MQGIDSQHNDLERKKLRAIPLETSTPKSYRNPPAVIDSDPESPVMGEIKQVMGMEVSESSSLEGNNTVPQGHTGHAGISLDVCDTLIIDRPRESKSLELRKVLTTTTNWEKAAIKNGLLRRSSSLPQSLDSLETNIFFSG